MKVRHTLICFFVLTLQAGNTGLLTAGHRILKPTEGGRITVACSFTFKSSFKFFCKQDCKEEILIETTSDQAENGRYRIEYSKTFFLSYPVLYVSITQLSKSDSGRYRCGLGRPLSPDSHEEFEIIVRDAAATSKPNWTLRPSSTSVPSASTPTTTQSLSSSSGSLTSLSASPKTTKQSGQQKSERATASADPGKLLYVGLLLVLVIFLLSLTLLLFCRRRANKPKECYLKRYTSVSEADRVCKYTKPSGVETNDDHSFADPDCTAAASSQHKAADDESKLTCPGEDFPNSTTALLSSAPAGKSNDVTNSVL